MSETKTYNGWSNYETWVVNLWIDNEEGSYRYWTDIAFDISSPDSPEYIADPNHRAYSLAQRLKDEHEDAMPELQGVWADLLNAAFQETDWHEIAANLLSVE